MTSAEDSQSLETKRQLIHLANGCFISALIYTLKPIFGLYILAPLLIALPLLRYCPRICPKNPVVKALMKHFERKKDIMEFPFKGAIFFGIGIMFPIVLLPTEYAVAVVLVVSVGDSISTLVGRRWGITKIGEKSVQGTCSFFVSAWFATVFFIGPAHALALSGLGAVIELYSFMDDNILIPASLSAVSVIVLV